MIGDMIKKRRTQLGLTQAQLAALTGIKSTTISNYENNVSTPNESNVLTLMKALDCDANYLYEYSEWGNLHEVSEDTKKTPPLKISRSEGQSLLSELDDSEKLELLNYLGYLKYKRNGGT